MGKGGGTPECLWKAERGIGRAEEKKKTQRKPEYIKSVNLGKKRKCIR